MTEVKVATRGPAPGEYSNAKNEEEMATGIPTLHSRVTALGGIGASGTKVMLGHSAELRFNKILPATLSNTSQMEQQSQSWRVSIGSSAHRVGVTYVGNSNVASHVHKWGTYGSRKNASEAISSSYQGTRVIALGAPGAHYSTKELENQSLVLMDQINFENGARVNSTHVWHRIWYNMCQVTLGQLDGDNYQRAEWQNRPNNPATYAHMINGLNHYNNYAMNMMIGQMITIELDTPERDLIPYLTYLLGAGPATFTYRWGADAGGANRAPHLVSKIPVGVNYGFLIRDNFNAAPAIPIDPALPGIAQGAPLPANSVVGDWDWNLLDRSLDVLARSMPIASDIEAGCIKACVDCFAEPFRGVAIGEVSGCNRRNAGNGAFLDKGNARMPQGNLICCFGTRIHEGSQAVRNARSRAQACSDMIRDVWSIRAVAELHVLPLQLACRQLGLTSVIAFPGLDPAGINVAGVPALNVTAASAMSGLTELTSSTVDEPSQLMLTTSMMMEVMYGAVLPESALYFDFGNTRDDASHPLFGEANIGECLVSVHAGQVVNNMLKPAAVGLAGIPNKMDVIAKEAKIEFAAAAAPVVAGDSGSVIDEGVADPGPGVYMLGHATIFMRDDNLAVGDQFAVEVAGFQDAEAKTKVLRAISVDIAAVARYAFSQDGTFLDAHPHLQVMALYSDFDRQRFTDLRLSLPNSATVGAYATSAAARSRVPGFVAAMIAGSFQSITGNIGIVMKQRSTKRRKVDGTTSVSARAPNNSSGSAGGVVRNDPNSVGSDGTQPN